MRTLDRANVKTFAFEGDESIFGGAAFVSDAVGSLLDSLEDESPVQASLAGLSVTDAECRAIAEVLQENQSLKKLDLSNNCFGDEGAVILANALEMNNVLMHINVSRNQISDTGAIAFSKMLHVNKTLRVLNLRANKIGREGFDLLSEALEKNSILEKLLLEFNEIAQSADVEA